MVRRNVCFAAVVVFGVCFVLSAASLRAAAFKSACFGIGFGDKSDYESIKASAEHANEEALGEKFFGTLGLALSDKGAVRTYAVVAVKNLKRTQGIRRESAQAGESWLEGENKIKSKGLIWPVKGYITSPFGRRTHPRTHKCHVHTGIDIAAVRGTPVVSAAAGKVVFVGWKSGYGKTLIIDHGSGLTTVYAHCLQLIAKKGQSVNAGQRIAKVGKTGVATGYHLHFEVRRADCPVNPQRFLKK